jgi:hypothetical protein
MRIEAQLICAIDGDAPDMTPAQWARVLAARERKGSMLTSEETLVVVETDDRNDRDDTSALGLLPALLLCVVLANGAQEFFSGHFSERNDAVRHSGVLVDDFGNNVRFDHGLLQLCTSVGWHHRCYATGAALSPGGGLT